MDGPGEEGEEMIPKAIWEGTFTIFGVELRCSVLDDEKHTRVINAEDLKRLFEVMGDADPLDYGDLNEFARWQRGG